MSQEERERNEREYVDYFLDVHEKVAKKGRSTAYDEIDRYINRVTDEGIISSASGKMIDGIKRILRCEKIGIETDDVLTNLL